MRMKHLAGAVGAAGVLALWGTPVCVADPAGAAAADPGAGPVAEGAAPQVSSGTAVAATAPAAADADAGVPHLSSPENLPPGTSVTPTQQSGTGVTYLRELWHAYQTQEVSRSDLLLLLSQRPMSAGAPPPISSLAPQAPVPEAGPPPAPADEPAPAPAAPAPPAADPAPEAPAGDPAPAG